MSENSVTENAADALDIPPKDDKFRRLMSFFVSDGAVKIMGGFDRDGHAEDFIVTLAPDQDFLGLPYGEFIVRGMGSLDFHPETGRVQFYGEEFEAKQSVEKEIDDE